MSQSKNNNLTSQAHQIAVQKLAAALAEQNGVHQDANGFQESLSQIVQKLAVQELLLIQRISGGDILEKISQAMRGQEAQFTQEQARQLGAFTDDGLGQDDLFGRETP